MPNVITYGLIAIVLLVLGFTVVMGLAKVKRAGKSAAKGKAGPGLASKSIRRSHDQAMEIANHLPGVKISGAIKKGANKNIGKIVNEHPKETIDLIRNWLHENNGENRD
ncbi:MAG: hypothetical protein KAI73_03120 [Rhodospirillaceae bacterium]|nr:hypothetical protein [Rhodospirillaceae bacterium]